MKRQLRSYGDRALRKVGLVRVSTFPMREFTVSYHMPHDYRCVDRGKPQMSINGVLRNGRRVVGDLREVNG